MKISTRVTGGSLFCLRELNRVWRWPTFSHCSRLDCSGTKNLRALFCTIDHVHCHGRLARIWSLVARVPFRRRRSCRLLRSFARRLLSKEHARSQQKHNAQSGVKWKHELDPVRQSISCALDCSIGTLSNADSCGWRELHRRNLGPQCRIHRQAKPAVLARASAASSLLDNAPLLPLSPACNRALTPRSHRQCATALPLRPEHIWFDGQKDLRDTRLRKRIGRKLVGRIAQRRHGRNHVQNNRKPRAFPIPDRQRALRLLDCGGIARQVAFSIESPIDGQQLTPLSVAFQSSIGKLRHRHVQHHRSAARGTAITSGLLPMQASTAPHGGRFGMVLVQQIPISPASAACQPYVPPRIQ